MPACALWIVALLAGFATGLSGVSVAADDAKPVPMEAFFKYADYGALELSPSGKYIGALVPAQGQVRLAVIDLDSRASRNCHVRGWRRRGVVCVG